MTRSGLAINVISLCFGAFLATPCAAQLSTAEIEQILEFDVAAVPEPETLLDAISGRSEYAKVAAQRQALADTGSGRNVITRAELPVPVFTIL